MKRWNPASSTIIRWFAVLAICGAPLEATAQQHGHSSHEDAHGDAPVEAQPLKVHIGRLRMALDYLGAPLTEESEALLDKALIAPDAESIEMIQQALDPYCLAHIFISPESRVMADVGHAARELVQHGWRQFLVKVNNHAGVTAPLRATSEQAQPIPGTPLEKVSDRWMDLQMFGGRPMTPELNGLGLEYRIIQIYSRDAGKRAAVVQFDVGQGSQDIGFRSDVTLTFNALPAPKITFHILDENDEPTTAALEIRDGLGRTYPSQAKRQEPDFAFHPQVYRSHGESLPLPPGEYTFDVSRGPEYLPIRRTVTLDGTAQDVEFRLKRWIDPAKLGWWSGDHHIHAAGCMHYTRPTEGVHPDAMARHTRGEDLKVGSSLNWGPSFDYQKQFFLGKVDPASTYPYLLRQDVEVSGFGSHQSGHLCLLRLREQIYPGGDSKHHWPTLGLNTLRWAQKQGAVCGPAHSGWGLAISAEVLPSYEVPPYDGIGANEYVVDVTHMVEGPDRIPVPAVDFMSLADTPYSYELNIWYHTLNCGFRTRVSGETDFPCIYGERVGLGRSYVKLDQDLDYDAWCEGISNGRAYVGDGRSHLIDFNVGGRDVGTEGSELQLDAPQTIAATVKVAAYLPDEPQIDMVESGYRHSSDETAGGKTRWPAWVRPYWHVERARVGDTRNVIVELIVNGQSVAQQKIIADGQTRDVHFDVPIQQSSWVALRILGTSHTNPVFVVVDGQPIRASRRSAQWCLDGVNQCWKQKKATYSDDEMEDAIAAYNHARQVYHRIIEESRGE